MTTKKEKLIGAIQTDNLNEFINIIPTNLADMVFDRAGSALHIAASNDSVKIAKHLFDNNLIEPWDEYQQPAIAFFNSKSEQMIDLFIKNGHSINEVDQNRRTILYLAVKDGDIELTRTILKFNPDLFIQNVLNKDVFSIALKLPNADDMFSLLLTNLEQQHTITQKTLDYMLLNTVKHNLQKSAIKLLIKGANPKFESNFDELTSDIIVKHNLHDVINYLHSIKEKKIIQEDFQGAKKKNISKL